MKERNMQNTEPNQVSQVGHSKTWIAMQKYRGTVTINDQSLFY